MDLDRQVAEALGEPVCGGTNRNGKCDRCGRPMAPIVAGCGIPRDYSTRWEAMGRLVEEMRKRGWRFQADGIGPDCYVTFWRRGDTLLQNQSYEGKAPTFPEAAAAAALRALGERREG
jgi:hypothetical protein